MSKDFSPGDRVVLKTFHGTDRSMEVVKDSENYWVLVGAAGVVALANELSSRQMAFHEKGRRVLITFDRNVNDLGLHCHNELPNSLWIFVSDLELA